ncbi:MAG: T9SS type A sorting domain-containing protein [Chitinophagales bacterium]|nr:T9SS type A sorting domain-containing protein [Chitinophagales bacterium]
MPAVETAGAAGKILKKCYIFFEERYRIFVHSTKKSDVESSRVPSVYSYLGSEVLEILPTGSSTVIDISKLASGSYFITINLGNEIITKRFAKAN